MRKISKPARVTALAFSAFMLPGIAIAQASRMDLKTAIETAVTNNHSLLADSLDIPVSQNRSRELAGFYKPQVNYNSTTEYNPAIASQMLPGAVAGQPDKELVPVQFGTRYSYRSGIEVTQTIFRKDLKLQIKNSGLQTRIARTKYNLSKEELVHQVSYLYFSLQTGMELIRTTAFDYENLKEVLDIAKSQYENGTLKRIDYESLQINVANKKSQLSQLQTQYDDQLAHFNYLLGLPASQATLISDSLPEELLPVEPGQGITAREDVLLSQQLIESKEIELKSIEAEKKPTVQSFFRYYYSSQFNEPGKAFRSDYLYNSSTVGITMSLPLFDGQRRKSRIRAAQIQVDQLKLRYASQQDKAKMEQVSTTGTLVNSQEQYVITKRNLALAEKVFVSRVALYAEGVTTLVELLDAERELSNARTLHIQSLIDVQTSRLDWHKANGTLLTHFIQSI